MSESLLLPTEACERIVDFIADTSRHTLLSCTLVSRAWLPRCRFHLCGVVILRSHQAFLSFSLLLSRSPQYATLPQSLSLCAKGSRNSDSWVATVPSILPPLPNLSQFEIHDFEIPYQHPTFFKVYSNFTLATPHSKLKLVNVSYDSFHLIALLADAVHASELELDSRSLLPYTSDGIVAHAISASNTWLTTVTIRIRSWMEMKQMDWDWILACPKLTFCALDADIDFERGGAISPFSPENADVWAGVCRVVLSMSARPNHAAQMEIRVWTSVHVVISVGSQDQQPTLHVSFDGTRTPWQGAWMMILDIMLQFSSCKIHNVDVDMQEFEWGAIHDIALSVCETLERILLRHHPFLHHLSILHPKKYQPLAGTDCTFNRDMFPRAFAKGVLGSGCTNAGCTRQSEETHVVEQIVLPQISCSNR